MLTDVYLIIIGVMSSIASKVGGFFLDTLQTAAGVVAVFFIIYLFFVQPHQVDGYSMYSTFDHGEYLLTDKITYKSRTPQRGEVVVFKAPPAAQCPAGTGCDYIKRIIGIGGDTIEVKDNAMWLNGKKLSEPYIHGVSTEPGAYILNRKVTLQPGEFFVSGDNRPHSSDSRVWGPITMNEIVGRVFFRYWPLKSFGPITAAVIQN